ncbi:HAD family hydrolase [Paracoccus sp. Z330]|uniref:HAD family hydrolase n=1 Tax=Paracoccus onchidii TaxID=3017813 RepID=A0ABT4ZAA8_9RHOB|nr:HAD family hydrolase [Paracoccus onchidii]MDB6176289.1 HAD family hydrolase [Paracoccus onchidii]
MTAPLIIFDCDGVLVDSEPISIGLMVEYCAAARFAISVEDAYRSFLGKPVRDAAMHIKRDFGVTIPPIDLEDFQRDILSRFERDLHPVHNVTKALKRLDAPKAVASSSNPDRIHRSLRLTGLDAFFGENIFSTDQVARGKPHPDVFLYAAEKMGFQPHHAIVVEDSPAGLIAAKAAGMRTIGFAGASHAKPADLAAVLAGHDPDSLIDDMNDLQQAIASLATNAA